MRKIAVLLMASLIFVLLGPWASVAQGEDVNQYIKSHDLSTPTIEKDHKSFLPKFNYRHGHGKPEGIVVHETANDNSTITGEINYMSNHYEQAFVHAFVDHSLIIEVHSTDYGAWGAGSVANQRFMHVELVRSGSFAQFMRSINNDAYYIASKLHQYHLGVQNAENTGKGTLWSHNAVTKYLGDTTHTDPIGYFGQWGYDWSDFVKLVKDKYDQIK